MQSIFIFILGTAFGSFLNAIEWRLSRDISIHVGRSSCDFCKKKLSAKHVIPLIGFFLIKGKCAYCKKRLPIQYPIVEFCMGAAAVLSFTPAKPLLSIYAFVFVWIMTFVLIYDLKYMLVPVRVLVYASFFFVLVSHVLFGPHMFLASIIGGVVGYLFYFVQHHISNGTWVGGGDMYIALFIGTALGIQALAYVLLLAYVIGALIGIYLLVSKRATRKARLPMGVFLSIASFIVVLFGSEMYTLAQMLGYG